MVDTLLKIFLEQLQPTIAVPLAIVLAALLCSLVGKLKSVFDSALTVENARFSIPYLAVIVAIAHACLGVGAASWFYFHTDLFSPPVKPDLSHPLGREYIRASRLVPHCYRGDALPSTPRATFAGLFALSRWCDRIHPGNCRLRR